MDKLLVKNLIEGKYKHSPGDDFADGMGGKVKVYVVETEKTKCRMWNSSNNSSFDVFKSCSEIATKILEEDDLCEGHFSIGFKEIWFEIEEK